MSATLLTSSPVWTAAGWTMLHLVWVGGAIGLMAALARRLLRSARPEARYGVALAWLMVLSVSPAMIFVWVLEPDSRQEIATVRVVKTSQTASSGSSVISELPRPEFRSAAVDPPISDTRRSRLEFLVPYLPWFWLVGSLSTLVMLATGLIGVEQLRRSSRLVEVGDLPMRCRALADSLGIVRRVGIGICDRLSGPILVGIIRPLILLPPAALSGWSVEQIEMVLLHELAHLRRWDNLVNLVQRVVESLLFFHPVAWWLSGWVRLERELCCDRLVVERLGRPFAYVEMLMTVAGSSHRGRRAVLAMADRQVMTRIRRLLNLEDRSMKLTMPEGLGVLVAVIVGVSLALGSQAAPPKPAGESSTLTFRMQEMPLLTRVEFKGRKAIPQKEIEDTTGLKAGNRTDPTRTRLAVGQIQRLYAEKGYDLASVTLLKGGNSGDTQVVIEIFEGPKVKIGSIGFVGNQYATDARLRTKIGTREPILGLFGKHHRDMLDEDRQKLIEYYQKQGFFDVKVTPVTRPTNEGKDELTFVISEGTQYRVRNVIIEGNTKIKTAVLREGMKLHSGKPFLDSARNADKNRILIKYNEIGCIDAELSVEPRFTSQPGVVDLLYHISEGEPYLLGELDIEEKDRHEDKVVRREAVQSPSAGFSATAQP